MDKIVANNLKKWRSQLNYSQDAIAKYLQISRENISYYENAERDIPMKHLERIAELFGIDADVLFDESEAVHEAELAFAYRTDELHSEETLVNIAQFKKLVRNYVMMSQKACE